MIRLARLAALAVFAYALYRLWPAAAHAALREAHHLVRLLAHGLSQLHIPFPLTA